MNKSCLVLLILSFIFATDAFARESYKERKAKEEAFHEQLEGAFGNFIAVQSGTLRSGEQIPLPVFADGTPAKRKDTHYMVSPAEMPTSITYTATGGAFVIKCSADDQGFVAAELWQQSGTGEGLKLVGKDSYKLVDEAFASVGYSLTDDQSVVKQQMKVFSQRLFINYLAIAIRSDKK